MTPMFSTDETIELAREVITDQLKELKALKAERDRLRVLLGEVGEPFYRDAVEDPKNCMYCYGWHDPDCLTVRIAAELNPTSGGWRRVIK